MLIRRLGVGALASRAEDLEVAAELRMARAAFARLDALAAEIGASGDVIERVRGFYAGRIERLEHFRELQASSSAHKTHHARLQAATHDFVGQLLEIEHAELQLIRNSTAIETPVAQRIQARLDSLRLNDRR